MEALEAVLEFIRHVTSGSTAKDVIAASVTQVARLLEPDQVVFFLSEEGDFRPVGSWLRPGAETCIDAKSPAVARRLCTMAVQSGRPQYAAEFPAAPDHPPEEMKSKAPISLAALPLQAHGRKYGVMTLASRGNGDFSTASPLLEALAQVSAFALHSALLSEQLLRQSDALKQEAAERAKAAKTSRRLGRALRIWTECHRALLPRSATEKELLDRVCRSIVESGDYRMAWVGYALDDENRSVRPMAQAGFEEGYLGGLNLTWAETETGRGPTGTAIRTGRTVVVQDIERHPPFKPWIAAARQRGYSSTVALPLTVEGRIIGVLRIYSSEPSAFSEDEVELLEELAENLAFGIEALRARAERRKYRESLEDMSELNQQIVSCSSDGIFVCDRDMRYVAWNPAMETMSGLGAAEVLGRSVRDVFPLLGDQRVSDLFAQAMAEGVVTTPDFRTLRRSPAGPGWAQGRLMPLRNSGGDVIGILATIHDITHRKKAEEALKESEFLFRSQFDLGNIGIAISSPEKRYLRVNAKLCHMLGYAEDELLQLNWADMTHPEDLPENLALFERMIRGEISSYEMDKRFFHKDGRIVHTHLTSSCYRSVDGTVRFIIASMLDISERKRMEAQLIQSEERLRLALQAANDGLWDWHIPSGNVYFSPRYYTMLGYEPGEFPAGYGSWRSLLHPDDRETAEAGVARGLQSDAGGFSLEFRMQAKQGGWVWVLARAKVVEWTDGGQPVRVVGTHTDITELKQIKAQQERFFQLSADLLCIAGLDGYFKLLSPSWARTLGWSLDELTSRPYMEFVHPDDRSATEQARRGLAEGEPVQSLENRYRTNGGDYRWLSWHALPVVEDGLVFGVARDITEQKQVEEEVRRQRDFAQRIIDTSPNVIYVHDLIENQTVFTNRQVEELLGYGPGEVARIAACWFKPIMHPEDARRVEKHLERLRRSREGEILEVEYRLKDTQGEWHWFSSRDTVFTRTAEGRVRQVLGAAQDITERRIAEEKRRRLEAQVRHVQKLESLGVLAGGIAHDFNNLLMGVMGNADLALIGLPPGSPVRHNLDEIQKAASRAADLCRQMLAYAGKGRFVLDHINLSHVVKDMANLLEVSVSKNATLRYRFAPGLPLIEADVTQMRQIIMNLVINASEAIGDTNGIITVSTGSMECNRSYLQEAYIDEALPEGTYVYLEVADTGCGMDEATRHKMFDPFFTTKFVGRGLGLAAVLGIVRGHYGTVKIVSEPGKGTTFRVLFPALADPKPSRRPSARETSSEGKGLVLLVDDEETVRTVAAAMIEKLGFRVVTARDGVEAVEIFRLEGRRIACVVLDLTMPRMDGEETFRRLRQLHPDIPVIISSGYNEQEVSQRFAGRGLAGFIQKPYDFKCLEETLGKALRTPPI